MNIQSVDVQWLNLVSKIFFSPGPLKPNRTKFKTKGIFGESIVIEDVSKDFPLLNVKAVHFRSMIAELCWFIRGDNNVSWLRDFDCKIWNEWEKPDGTIGPGYGPQWRGKNGTSHGVDQLLEACRLIKEDPNNRRILVSAWDVSVLKEMALTPCHVLFQFNVDEDVLNLQYYQRSCDLFLGVPFNIASYAALLVVIARLTGKTPGKLVSSMGDIHLYENQLEPSEDLLMRCVEHLTIATSNQIQFKYEPIRHDKTNFTIEEIKYELDNITPLSFSVSNYSPWKAIKVEVAV